MKAPAFLARWFNRNGTGTNNGSSQLETKPQIVLDRLRASVPADSVIGAACCRHCSAELELVCPNGHGGADQVLADLAAPKQRIAAPPRREESGMLNCSIPGCDAPRVPWKGRGRKPTRCTAHLTKHSEQKRKLA